ncbi:MAG TPA: nitroreductase family protein [Dysgonamonadaceae bacterium]|nr:nitroreductase family protein [Dysgonamonadaceae bacterium]
MKKNLRDAIKDRRTYYQLQNTSPVSDEEIQSIIEHVLYYAPSAFNSQSARMVLLLGDNHTKMWEITKEELKKVSKSEEAFKVTEEKVNTSFASGYGTILFFEDKAVVKGLQSSLPTMSDKFDQWSEHSSAIAQILTWIGLESVGFGASLQHYNPLIDEAVKKEWNLNQDWELVAQMPFGTPAGDPGEKTHVLLEERLVVVK